MEAIEYVSIPKEEYEHLKSCKRAYELQLLEERKRLSDEITEKQQEAVKSIITTGMNFPIKH